MSRIGKKPVDVLDGVKVTLDGSTLNVEGPKGKLQWQVHPEVTVTVDEGAKSVNVARRDDERASRALHGLTRAVINNMILGVKNGYEKRLEVQGVGYVCSIKDKKLQLRVGFANELKQEIPAGLEVTCPDQTHIVIKAAINNWSASSLPKSVRCESLNRTRAKASVTKAKSSSSSQVSQLRKQ